MLRRSELKRFAIALEMTIAPNPFQILTWWGAHTNKIRLGTGVVAAPYWHPIRLAGEAAFTDLITGGRLEFGIGSGAYQREFDRMKPGLKQTDGWRYMQELLPAVKQLWKGDYEHKGEYWEFPTSTSVPKPIQTPHPPIWMAARSPITYDYVNEKPSKTIEKHLQTIINGISGTGRRQFPCYIDVELLVKPSTSVVVEVGISV